MLAPPTLYLHFLILPRHGSVYHSGPLAGFQHSSEWQHWLMSLSLHVSTRLYFAPVSSCDSITVFFLMYTLFGFVCFIQSQRLHSFSRHNGINLRLHFAVYSGVTKGQRSPTISVLSTACLRNVPTLLSKPLWRQLTSPAGRYFVASGVFTSFHLVSLIRWWAVACQDHIFYRSCPIRINSTAKNIFNKKKGRKRKSFSRDH